MPRLSGKGFLLFGLLKVWHAPCWAKFNVMVRSVE